MSDTRGALTAAGSLPAIPVRRGRRAKRAPRSVPLVALIVFLLCVFLLGSVLPAGAAAAPQSSQRFVGLYQVGSPAQAAQRYDVVILNEWNASQISGLRAANPAVKVLLYKNTYFLRADDNASTVGGFKSGENISVRHPDWFLLDSAGNRIVFQYYAGIDFYAMDWGNPGWRDYWAAHAIGRAQALGFDGLFLDDLYTTPWGEIDRPLRQYSNGAALQAAVRGFLATIYAKTKAADPDLLVIGNVADHLWFPDLFADWLTISDGLMDEQFVHAGDSTSAGYTSIEDWWKRQLDEVTVAEQMGKHALFISRGAPSDYQAMLFAYGSYMLAAGGNSRYYHKLGPSLNTPTWFDLWARDLGAPQDSYTVGSDGLYSRDFAAGKVIVNPSKSSTRTVSVSGYLNEDGAPVTSVTLAPHRAVFVFKAASTIRTLPPTTAWTMPPTTAATRPPTTATTPPPRATTTTIPAAATATATGQALPVIQFVKPVDRAIVKSRVTVEVKATSSAGIHKAELLADGTVLGTDRSTPYNFLWDTAGLATGDHTLLAIAYDGTGNVAATALTVKSLVSGQRRTKIAIAGSTYRFSGTSAFLDSTGVLHVE